MVNRRHKPPRTPTERRPHPWPARDPPCIGASAPTQPCSAASPCPASNGPRRRASFPVERRLHPHLPPSTLLLPCTVLHPPIARAALPPRLHTNGGRATAAAPLLTGPVTSLPLCLPGSRGPLTPLGAGSSYVLLRRQPVHIPPTTGIRGSSDLVCIRRNHCEIHMEGKTTVTPLGPIFPAGRSRARSHQWPAAVARRATAVPVYWWRLHTSSFPLPVRPRLPGDTLPSNTLTGSSLPLDL